MTIRRWSGPTPTSIAGEYRVWLSGSAIRGIPSPVSEASPNTPHRLSLEKNATFTFANDLKVDLQMIDLLLNEASANDWAEREVMMLVALTAFSQKDVAGGGLDGRSSDPRRLKGKA